jgi:hypothetical protein
MTFPRNQGAAERSCGLRLTLGWSFLWMLFLVPGRVQSAGVSAPVIDSASVRIKDGQQLTFEFRAVSQDASSFAIETAAGFTPSAAWSPSTGTQIEAVADRLFRVTLAVQSNQLFCRVRTLNGTAPGPTLWINEAMSDNVSAWADGNGEYWDWIEIYNPSDTTVDLQGYALSDDLTSPGKWQFPALLLQAHAHLVVYASDLNRTNEQEALHTNFKLKATGETLLLSDTALAPVDRFSMPALAPDQSFGRSPDGGADFQIYDPADVSPGRENTVLTTGKTLLPPVFTPDGGFFTGPVTVHIAGTETNQSIRYTRDGTAPTVQSPRLTSDLTLDRSTVLRVIVVGPQGELSAPDARTYFIGVQHSLPVLSVATAPTNLAFHDGYLVGMGPKVLSSQNQVLQSYPYPGSYAWLDREIEVALEFFETNRVVGFRQRAGMKVYGGWGSRAYPQKSLALFARQSYGAGKFSHRIFPDLDVNEFEALVLRNSGNDNQGTQQTPPRPPISEFGPTESYGSYFVNGHFTMLRDALAQRLLRETELDTQAYRPAVIYVNGDYAGIYNLREKMNEAYVLSHHDVTSEGIDLIEAYGAVNAGTGTVYSQMRQDLAAKNMAVTSNYAAVMEKYLEIDNLIDYHLAVLYFQNFDIGNIKCWRPHAPRGRFRWMVYDQDYGFNLWPPAVYLPAMARDYADYDNMFDFYTAGTGTSTAWPNAGGRTLILRSLLKNAQFKERFIRRCADLLNSCFREDKVAQTILEMAAVIRPEMAAHLQRWSWSELVQRGFGKPHQAESKPFTLATWETNLTILSAFGQDRPAKLRADCQRHFALTGGLGVLRVVAQPENAARLMVNSLRIDRFPWQGIYFADITNTLQAIPNPGFRLVEWLTASGNASDPAIAFRVQRDQTNTITARFEPAPANPGGPAELTLTEIQYHPRSDIDSGDWVELSNTTPASVPLDGWILRDEDDGHAFLLPHTSLAPGASLVLCQDESQFRLYHPASVAVAGNFHFGLGNSGGTVRLFRPDGTLAWAISYEDTAPWPAAADGGGSTLQWTGPGADPNLPGSWKASAAIGGEPGRF